MPPLFQTPLWSAKGQVCFQGKIPCYLNRAGLILSIWLAVCIPLFPSPYCLSILYSPCLPPFSSWQPTWLLTLPWTFDSFWLDRTRTSNAPKRTGGLATLWARNFIHWTHPNCPSVRSWANFRQSSLLLTWSLFKLLLMHFMYYFVSLITYSLRQDKPRMIPALEPTVYICTVCKHCIRQTSLLSAYIVCVICQPITYRSRVSTFWQRFSWRFRSFGI
jgi:hypothetical protein